MKLSTSHVDCTYCNTTLNDVIIKFRLYFMRKSNNIFIIILLFLDILNKEDISTYVRYLGNNSLFIIYIYIYLLYRNPR